MQYILTKEEMSQKMDLAIQRGMEKAEKRLLDMITAPDPGEVLAKIAAEHLSRDATMSSVWVRLAARLSDNRYLNLCKGVGDAVIDMDRRISNVPEINKMHGELVAKLRELLSADS